VKRLAKIFLAALLFLLAAIIGLTIYVKVKYPSERLRQLLISYVAEEYKLRVAIARLDFNLFSGFELDKVAILGAINDSVSTFAAPPLAVEKIKFSYRWRSLLARQLDIDEITIERPAFFYQSNPDSVSNLDAIIAAFADFPPGGTPSDTASAGLPISIHLKTLKLENLQINAVLASAVESQNAEFGPVNLTVNEIEVDRAAHFRGKIDFNAAPANLHYLARPVGQGDSAAVAAQIQSRISGSFSGDSIAVMGDLTLNQSRFELNDKTEFSLPRFGITADICYDFAFSRLAAPDIRLLIDGKEQLAARFELNQQNGLSAFALRVNRGRLDLAPLLNLARTHTSGERRDFLQSFDCAGGLEFSGSELGSNDEGLSYQIALRGRELAYTDYASGLKLSGGNLEANWKTSADSSAQIAGTLRLETFDVPVGAEQTLKTGPVDLKTDLALTKDFLPQQGELDLNWKNFFKGKINLRAAIAPSSIPVQNGSWLSRLLGRAEIQADAIDISAFAAGAASGKISGKITLAGKRLDESEMIVHLNNSTISYETIEYKGKIPAYHLSAFSQLLINPALTKFSLTNGKLQIEPVQTNFNATYDMKADTFRFDLPNLAIDLAQARSALPDTILASMNYATIKGRGVGNGWLKGRFIDPDSLDYKGIFALHSNDAFYADSVLGIEADSLQIDSEWILAASQTSGQYTVACSAPKLQDYLRQHLPPTKVAGKLTVDETTFAITDGQFEIPNWQVKGDYRVEGEYLQAGVQVKTTVDFGLHAPRPIMIDRGTALRGDAEGQIIIDQYIPDEALEQPQSSRLNGWLRIDGMEVRLDTTLALHDLKADCRFNQDFDLLYLPIDSATTKGMKLEAEDDLQPYFVLKASQQSAAQNFANADEALLMYDLFREPRRDNSSWLTIGKAEVFGYQLSNFAADLNLGNCRFDVPKFSVNLFDGNLVGNLLVGLGSGNPDSISYAANMQISSIDVSRFRRLSAQLGGKQSRVSANFFLSGLGAAPEKLDAIANNLSGRLNITKIENRVASNLLQTLDPNGTDKGIQNIRLLMKTRWNVRQLTFEMKNGFVYASLAHVKPWYAPFTLPQPLDFARFPVKPYLKTAAAE
jgi:autotransporter translocation and assembly factor TamB